MINKAKILSDLRIATMEQEVWQAFHKWADLGLPLAALVTYGFAESTEKGDAVIDETYSMLLKVLELPEDAEFDSLKDLFDAAVPEDEVE
jgi:hypothetical protein